MPAIGKTGNEAQEGGWIEYRRLVLSELERINTTLKACESHSSTIHVSLSTTISDVKQNLMEKLHSHKEIIEKDYETKIDKLEERVDRQGTQITGLKVTCSLLGGLAGFVVAVAGVLATLYTKN